MQISKIVAFTVIQTCENAGLNNYGPVVGSPSFELFASEIGCVYEWGKRLTDIEGTTSVEEPSATDLCCFNNGIC
jgi:hypothetical protein